MAEDISSMSLKAVGMVRNEMKQAPQRGHDWWSELVSEIVIEVGSSEALDGLEDFSHIIVLFWFHQIEREVLLKIHPMGRQDIPLTGLFATRTPSRPNRVGVTAVRLLERNGNILKVKGLDAIDGTPVIDIKPYIPVADMITDAKVPQWIANR